MNIRRILILLTGVVSCSTSVIMIKLSNMHPVLLVAYRLLLAAMLLTPLWVHRVRRHRESWRPADLKATLLPSVFLSMHFILWVMGARLTFAANAALITNMMPVAMPFLSYFLWRERINRREIAGTVLALGGVLVLGLSDWHFASEKWAGDILCFFSMLCFASYLSLSRRSRDVADIWLFIVPLYYAAGLLCLAIAWPLAHPVHAYSLREILLIVGLAVIPTIIGHSALMSSMHHLRSQIVVIGTLGQFVFAGIFAYFIFREIPGIPFYISSVFLVAGVVLAIQGEATVRGTADEG